MAILKHLASKNSDYGRALEYVMFQHDEEGRMLLDDHGHRIQRKEYILEGLNCDPYLFDAECRMVNHQYHKNSKPEEIKSHHYILSFDPKDAEEGKLNGEKAQALAMEFAKRYFAGHQAIVCTHTDGHNESGNIHTHIIINSVRKLDVTPDYFTERPCDSRAGYKHHLTDQYRQHLHQAVMDMCEREGLHQVDLLGSAQAHVTDKEHYAAQRGQRKLEKLNQEITDAGLKPAHTVFQTQKQYIRDAISAVSRYACSQEEFFIALREKYNITGKEHRGRYSYLHPDRQKYITGRTLGTDYDKDFLLPQFESNRRRTIDAVDAAVDSEASRISASDYHADPIAILYIQSHLRLVTDLQTCIKAQQSAAYARKVKISNLKEMARTVIYIQEHGYDTMEDLQRHQTQISEKKVKVQAALSQTDTQIKETNAQIHFTGQYYATRQVQKEFLKTRFKKKYREEHKEELEKYNEASTFFQEYCSGKVPSLKKLKEKKEKLLTLQSEQRKELSGFDQLGRELQTATANVESILQTDNTPNVRRSKKQPEL